MKIFLNTDQVAIPTPPAQALINMLSIQIWQNTGKGFIFFFLMTLWIPVPTSQAEKKKGIFSLVFVH
jgi:hypothetical protein